MRVFSMAIAGLLALTAGCAGVRSTRDPALVAESKAVAFLKQEVPAWPRDNGCFSCHNNGDGARALYAASRKGYRIPANALADTTAWVTQPEHWDRHAGDPGFSDKRLAHVQFSVSLLAALESGRTQDRRPLAAMAAKLLPDQDSTGAWPIGLKSALGAPATYGTPLATCMAIQSLKQAALPGTDDAIRRGELWLRDSRPDNTPAAVAILLAFVQDSGGATTRQKEICFDLLKRAQTGDGGWGPYPDSPPEAFDTAIALLALARYPDRLGGAALIQRGRAFLVAQQLPDGSWPTTTRPAGNVSYAQHISTTAWATLALLETRE